MVVDAELDGEVVVVPGRMSSMTPRCGMGS